MRKFLLSFVLLTTLGWPVLADDCTRFQMEETAWYTAKREMRRRFPTKADAITAIEKPKVEYHCGLLFTGHPFAPFALGLTRLDEQGVITVYIAVTENPQEDYWSEVHEFLHVINWSLELTQKDRMAADRWIETEYAAGTK